jgi:protein SCO1/2
LNPFVTTHSRLLSPGRAAVLVLVPALALLGGASAAGCRRAETKKEESAAGPVRRYPFHGVVHEVKNGGHDVMVAHDAVPGFMAAMTMLFPARGPAEVLGALAPGDTIDATLVVDDSRYWIEGIRRKPGTGGAASVSPASVSEPPPPGAVTPVPNRATSVGEAVPDFELTDQTNHPVRLSSLRGDAVAVTFLYTRCPIATACPMTTAKFSRLDAMLAQKGFGKLLIVTVDPEHDTPKVLADYAAKAGADPKRWKFLTGDPKAVADVASAFGILYYPDHGQIVHGQGVAVVGPDGRLASIYYGQTWEPEHILRDIEKARKE